MTVDITDSVVTSDDDDDDANNFFDVSVQTDSCN